MTGACLRLGPGNKILKAQVHICICALDSASISVSLLAYTISRNEC